MTYARHKIFISHDIPTTYTQGCEYVHTGTVRTSVTSPEGAIQDLERPLQRGNCKN